MSKQQQTQNLVDKADPDGSGLEIQRFEDAETHARRMTIFNKINKRRKQDYQGTTANKQANYSSVVNEFSLLQADLTILGLIKDMFKFERKLKPIVKKRQAQPIDQVDKTKLMIHVIRGTDVPVRHSYYQQFLRHLEDKDTKTNRDIYTEKQVETFLEARLVDEENDQELGCQRTCLAEGQCPEWNELLDFKICAKNKMHFSKEELQQSKLVVYFTLFDQLMKEDKISKLKKIVQKENRYLGSFKIPLTSILTNNKFEGHI